MSAKSERRKTELYAMDLLWMLAKSKYDLTSPPPSKIEYGDRNSDKRSAEEIKNAMLEKVRNL